MSADVLEYTGSQFVHKPGTACHIQELNRGQPAALWMLPADQRLRTFQLCSRAVHDWLVEHIQAVGFERFPQFVFQRKPGARCHLDFRIEQRGTVPALPFGMIHGRFSAAEKLLGLMTVAREMTDAHTGTDVKILVGNPDWLANPALDLTGHFIKKPGQGVVADDQCKFVPANSCQKVFTRQLDFFQAQTDIGDHLVASLRAQTIVDGFQTVDIDPE